MHEDAVHNNIKHQCPHCDYQASYKRQLKIHESVTHNITEYKCDKCDFTAKRKLYVSQHELRFQVIYRQ